MDALEYFGIAFKKVTKIGNIGMYSNVNSFSIMIEEF